MATSWYTNTRKIQRKGVTPMENESAKKKTAGLLAVLSDRWKSRGVPFTFERIGENALVTGYKDTLLPKAEIPSELCGLSVQKIAARAFLECPFLEEMRIADGVEVIGANAFSSCDKLTKFHMADSVRELGRNAFFECRNLYEVTLSRTLRTIESRAFFGCTGLRDITLPDSLEAIGESAFCGCEKLYSIRIPLALKTLPRNAFDGCAALAEIYLEKGSPADLVLSDSAYFSEKLRYIPRI